MNDKQNLTSSGHVATGYKETNNSRKIAVARALIYIPLFASVIFGLIFMYFSISDKGDDQSGLTYVVNGLIAGGLFAVSLLVSTVCIMIGLFKLRRAMK